ncbi:MAG TPA: CoA pyrophosphatase [Chloroflexi bacterium]|nr:CoA pyrophosphatase [Chloroflexota bacterium]
MTMPVRPPLPTLLARRLAGRERRSHQVPAGWRGAAVLVPLSWHAAASDWYILFTVRSQTVRTHTGQISFPGGGRDPGDSSLLETALRETEEELGVRPDDVQILGSLDDVISYGSAYVVSPWVGVIPQAYEFRPNRDEIDELIEVPISFFRHPGSCRVELWEVRGQMKVVHFYDWNGHTIWGLTARILLALLAAICEDQPSEE